MIEKVFKTASGEIHYWTNTCRPNRIPLVFLPGLTADHRLFETQVEAFEESRPLLVWDPPGHAASRPFRLDFTLMDTASWLHGILLTEGLCRPVLIGQSMGGYAAQCFLERWPEAAGFISIDSAPLQRRYVSQAEIQLLKRTEPMYRAFPWRLLRSIGISGCAVTPYGRALMASFLDSYSRDEYCRLSAHGSAMLAQAMEADLSYRITCPAVLICGEKDRAGSARRYNRKWSDTEGFPLYMIEGAGHNANTDRPQQVNQIILRFLDSLKEERQ